MSRMSEYFPAKRNVYFYNLTGDLGTRGYSYCT